MHSKTFCPSSQQPVNPEPLPAPHSGAPTRLAATGASWVLGKSPPRGGRAGVRRLSLPYAMAADPGVSSPHDSVSTASDITLDEWNLDDADLSVVVNVDGGTENIPMAILPGEPIAGLHRIRQGPPTRWQRLCLGDPVGVFILVTVVLGLLLFVYTIPWLAGTYETPTQPGATPSANVSSTTSGNASSAYARVLAPHTVSVP